MYLTQLYILSDISGGDASIILWIVIAIAIFAAYVIILIFYPDIIIRLFKLDKGFDDNEIKTEIPGIEKLIIFATVIIGGIFIAQSFSALLIDIGYLINNIADTHGLAESFYGIDKTRFYINILNIIIGFLLISNYRAVTKFLLSVNKKKESKENT